jgi:hypothetical protein
MPMQCVWRAWVLAAALCAVTRGQIETTWAIPNSYANTYIDRTLSAAVLVAEAGGPADTTPGACNVVVVTGGLRDYTQMIPTAVSGQTVLGDIQYRMCGSSALAGHWYPNGYPYTPDEVPPFGPRFGHGMHVLPSGALFLFGGVADAARTSFYNSAYTGVYRGANDNPRVLWGAVQTVPWTSRAFFASCVRPDGTVVMAGGQVVGVSALVSDVYTYTGASGVPSSAFVRS